MTKNVIIDCDTGLDDAVALLLAIRSPALNVIGITCVNGNVSLDKVINNTLRVVDHSGKNVPVYAGAAAALKPEKSANAAHVHGSDGLGGIPFPASTRKIEQEYAVDFIIRVTMEAKQPLEWITIAPLTNIALAILKEPRIIDKVQKLTMMAGGLDSGNSAPMSEFNIFADPDAAKIVFDSAIPKTMVPLDPLSNGGYLTKNDVAQVQANSHKPWCDMAGKIFSREAEMRNELGRKQFQADDFASPPDLLAMAVAIEPNIANMQEYPVYIETKGEYTRGMTVVDRRRYSKNKQFPFTVKTKVVLSVDQKKYASLVLDTWLK